MSIAVSHVIVKLVPVTCSQCGCVFGLNSSTDRERREDHRIFYCPNGHNQYFPQETDTERAEKAARRAQELLDQERRRNESLRQDSAAKDRQLSAAKGQMTRMKNQIQAGVCPCCLRTFKNLAAHMKGQHPGFAHE